MDPQKNDIAASIGEPVAVDERTRLRATIAAAIVCCILLALIGRLAQIQLVDGERYRRLALQQQVINRELSARRGNVYDSNGRLLATSVERNSIFVDPSEVQDRLLTGVLLARTLGLDEDRLLEKLASDRLFVWVKRQVSQMEAAVVRGLRLPGVHMRKESKRTYPQGSMAAHVVGFTDIDGRGLAGVELELDSLLSGRAGREEVRCDGGRRVMRTPDYGAVEPPLNGCDVYLTIDCYVQNILEEELEKAAKRHEPECAMAVVLDPRTGRVLALANWPRFDPAAPCRSAASDRRNHVVTDVYEFGSVLKPFTISAALEEEVVTPQSEFDCHRGLWRVGRRTLHDVHPWGVLTVSDIICKSSNIGAAQVGMELGRERLYERLLRFGFGRPTGVRLPGEAGGILRPVSQWSSYSVVSISFGQELAATQLGVARAFCVFANGGLLVRPRIVQRVVESRTGRTLYRLDPRRDVQRILSRKTAAAVMRMLVQVVEDGTGKRARLDGYVVAGKTGTAQLPAAHGNGYSRSRYLSSFVGIAPADDPQVVVLVSLRAPTRNGYYGGVAAAPACREVIRRALQYLKVPARPAGGGSSGPATRLARAGGFAEIITKAGE